MPKNDTIKAIGINEQMLSPHLRNKFSNNSSNTVISSPSGNTNKIGIAGEAITIGQLIYQGNDLKWYKANITTHQAEYVAMTSASTDGTFEYSDNEDFLISSPATVFGDILVLGVNGAFKVASALSDGDIYQIVGRALGSDIVHIKIESWYPVVIQS